MRFGKCRSRLPGGIGLFLGGFVVSTVLAVTAVAFGAEPEMSIFPGAKPEADSKTSLPENFGGPVDQNPSSISERDLNLGRLDRSERNSRNSDLKESLPGLPPRQQRVDVRINMAEKSDENASFSLPLPEGITLGPNDVLAKSALAEIPKGEGYEATVSANTQGKLILLGLQKFDADGKPMTDEDGNPVMFPMHRGMEVKEGDILGVQFNQASLARKTAALRELDVAKKEAGKQLEVEVATASKNVARMEYVRAVNSNKKMPDSVSQEEVTQKQFEWFRGIKSEAKAEYDLEIAKLQVDVKEAAIAIAEADLEERIIRAPLSGQVDQILTNKGEWLREGDPVLHVLRLDKVNIKAVFESSTTTPAMVQGKAVTLYATMAGLSPQKLEGVITYARPVLEMNHFIAYAEVKNIQIDGSWFLLPGMRVNLIVHKDQTAERTPDEMTVSSVLTEGAK